MMPSRPVGVADTAPGTGVVEVDLVERASPDLTTTLTADPGAAGTTLAVASAAKFPATNNYKVRVENEVMLVTAGAGTLSWTVTRGVDNTTAVAHVSGTVVAHVVGVQRVSPVSERMVSFQGLAATFRTPGRTTTTQNIFAIFNASGSKVLIAVRRLAFQMDATAALTAVSPLVKVSRITAVPTFGTALTKGSMNTTLASSASATVHGDASADGTGSATTLTATAGTPFWSQYLMKIFSTTQVGQVLMQDEFLIPAICDADPIILQAAQGLLVHIVAAATTSNPATNHYIVNCMWEEFTSP